jgi:hypothetical protein
MQKKLENAKKHTMHIWLEYIYNMPTNFVSFKKL